MPITNHPAQLARSLAQMLESDLVATAQITEHISETRLCEILGISPQDVTELDPVRHLNRGDIPAIVRKFGANAFRDEL